MKKIISVLLSVNILFSICIELNFSAFAETITGKAGENSTYSFDKETGTLIVSGTGAVDFYDALDLDDEVCYLEIHSIIVEEGITSCEFQNLFGIGALKQIKYSSTVKDPDLLSLIDLVSSLSEIVVDKNNPYYSSDDGVLYNKEIGIDASSSLAGDNTSLAVGVSLSERYFENMFLNINKSKKVQKT